MISEIAVVCVFNLVLIKQSGLRNVVRADNCPIPNAIFFKKEKNSGFDRYLLND